MITRHLLRAARLSAVLVLCSAQGLEGPLEVVGPEGVLRVVNASRYELVDVRVNERQKLDWGESLPLGSSTDFRVSPGRLDYAFGAGFWVGLTRDVWFGSAGRTVVAPGQTVTITVSNPSLAQLLTDFSYAADWEGVYLDARGEVHTRVFHVNAAGVFTLSSEGQVERAGLVHLVRWPGSATTVTFRLCDPECGEEIEIAHPFRNFAVANGPRSWPLIEYIRQ